MSVYSWGVLAGLFLMISGSLKLLTGEDSVYWGIPVPAWSGWFFLPAGIAIAITSFRSLRRSDAAPKRFTEEEIAQAEAELDAMYLRETGEMPSKPEEEQ